MSIIADSKAKYDILRQAAQKARSREKNVRLSQLNFFKQKTVASPSKVSSTSAPSIAIQGSD